MFLFLVHTFLFLRQFPGQGGLQTLHRRLSGLLRLGGDQGAVRVPDLPGGPQSDPGGGEDTEQDRQLDLWGPGSVSVECSSAPVTARTREDYNY